MNGVVIVPMVVQDTAAKKLACKALVSSYQAQTATVQEAKQYASCIGLLHPDSLTPGEASALRVVIAALLIAVAAGAVWGYRDAQRFGDKRLIGILMGVLLWVVVVIAVGLGLAAIVAGVNYLIGGLA